MEIMKILINRENILFAMDVVAHYLQTTYILSGGTGKANGQSP